jgi:tetratricopeptide (TPR) repeat protein
MSERGWAVAHLDDVERHAFATGQERLAIRKHLGIEAFGVNAYSAEAGGTVIEEHMETESLAAGHQELYVVLDGAATFTIDGDAAAAPAGTLVFVGDPGTRRSAVAGDTGATVLVVGAPAGEAYEVGAWEEMAAFFVPYREGDYDAAIALLEDFLRLHPGYGGALYNLACCQSLAGRVDPALEYLREALEREPNLRDVARNDEDFVPLRDDARFRELVQ